jgi:hypothetical protein
MPDKLLYLLLALFIVAGFSLVDIVKTRIRRRRDDRRLEQAIAEYFRQKAAGKE